MTLNEYRLQFAKNIPVSAGYRVHRFKVCSRCGWMRWANSEHPADGCEPVYAFDEFNEQDYSGCKKCEEMLRRNPEIAVWVINCLHTLAAKIESER